MARALAFVKRSAGLLKRVGEIIPLTPMGAVAIAMLVWLALALGVARQERVVLSIAILGLAWSGLAIVMVAVADACLWLWPPKILERTLGLEAGQPTFTGLTLSKFGWSMILRLECQWLEPVQVATEFIADHGRFAERVTASQRTKTPQVVRRLCVSDALGLARVCIRVHTCQPVTVLPDTGQTLGLATMDFVCSGDAVSLELGPPDGDLAEFRRYASGDPLKRIVWKLFARTRQVFVRMPERAVSTTNKARFYFLAGGVLSNSLLNVCRKISDVGVAVQVIDRRSGGTIELTNLSE